MAMKWFKDERRRIKQFFRTRVPGLKGKFRYHHTWCYFPEGSIVVQRFFDTGSYEPETVELAIDLAGEDATVFDIGSHLGMISIPILRRRPGVKVIGVEASPKTFEFLKRTRDESSFTDRWTLHQVAATDEAGTITFFAHNAKDGAYDGIQATGRGEGAREVSVEAVRVDSLWEQAGRPKVSLVKMDVEGAEISALKGMSAMLASERPALLLEWNTVNLKAHGVAPGALLDWARANDYRIFSQQYRLPVEDAQTLAVHSQVCDNFLLLPADSSDS